VHKALKKKIEVLTTEKSRSWSNIKSFSSILICTLLINYNFTNSNLEREKHPESIRVRLFEKGLVGNVLDKAVGEAR
jgi:hypothetical protein